MSRPVFRVRGRASGRLNAATGERWTAFCLGVTELSPEVQVASHVGCCPDATALRSATARLRRRAGEFRELWLAARPSNARAARLRLAEFLFACGAIMCSEYEPGSTVRSGLLFLAPAPPARDTGEVLPPPEDSATGPGDHAAHFAGQGSGGEEPALDAFRSAMKTACEQALDAGVFNQDEFTELVLARCRHLDPARDIFVGDCARPKGWAERRAFLAELDDRVGRARRGTWAVHHAAHDDRPLWRLAIADGSGTLAPGGSHGCYDAPPTFDVAYRRMVGYEIYIARLAVEAERTRIADVAALRRAGLVAGTRYRDLRIDGTLYSTVVVGSVDREHGTVSLHLSRRGSPKRWTATVGGAALARLAEHAAQRRPAPPPPASPEALTLL